MAISHAKLIIGAPSKNENLFWATNFFAPDQVIFAEVDSQKILVVGKLEYDRARKESKVDTVLMFQYLDAEEKLRFVEEYGLSLLRKYGVSSVTVEQHFPAASYQYLSEHGISFEFGQPLFPEREIKTEDEIADIRYAQHAMEEVFPILENILADAEIREGKVWKDGEWVTSEMLRLIFDTELMKRDCLCEVTIIASGDQAADPHCFGFGPIIANTPIIFDMFPRSRKRWFFSDMSRVRVKGKLSDEARKIYAGVFEAQHRGLFMVRPGINFYDIQQATVDFFAAQGFATGQNATGQWHGYFHGVGHGVGLEIHEPPRVMRNFPAILREGQVLTIEPGLYYRGIGGVRIEDTILVTEKGYENLAHTPKELVELP